MAQFVLRNLHREESRRVRESQFGCVAAANPLGCNGNAVAGQLGWDKLAPIGTRPHSLNDSIRFLAALLYAVSPV